MVKKGIRIAAILTALLVCFFTGSFHGYRWLWVLPAGFAGSLILYYGLGFLWLILLCKTVDIEKPQEQDDPFFRKLLFLIAQVALDLLQTRMEVRGLDMVPENTRFLLVCNHLDIMDPVVISRYFAKKDIAFISKKENADMFIVGPVMHRTMCQMIDRDNDRAALRTIINCINLIKEDRHSIAVFPEGYTSLDGKLKHFRPGVFKIAIKAKVPIVVCTLQNTQNILRSAAHLKPVDVAFHVVGVIPAESFAGRTAVQLSEQAHEMMLEDLGPDFLDTEENNA